MENQTDGPEWVLATLFIIGFLVVIGAAVREIVKLRRGDPGGVDREPKKR